MSQRINDFFKEYTKNFSTGNVSNIVNAYSLPTCFYTATGISAVMDEAIFYKNCEEIVRIYDHLNMKNPKHEILSIKKLNSSTDLVEIRWDFFNKNKKIVSFTTIYIIGESDNTIKILGVFEVDEHDKVGELEARNIA